jgi:hypothetical protein
MITNKLNLPQPFVDAATSSHKYKPNRYSVTEVLGGTCEAVLKRRHAGEATEDVSSMLWAILGTAVHKVLESAQSGPEQHQEQWICVSIDNDGETYELSGVPDLYDESDETVTDWKVTSVWQVTFGDYEKWRRQTATYCWMLRQLGHRASRGQIVAMLRDYSQRKARTERDYPPYPVQTVGWDFTDEDMQSIGRDVADWFSDVAFQEKLSDEELTPCNPEQRWHKPDKWAVVKNGNKRATKVLDSEGAAEGYMDQLREGAYHIEFREGEDTRCQSYCSVAQFCPYGRKFFQDSENSQTPSADSVL